MKALMTSSFITLTSTTGILALTYKLKGLQAYSLLKPVAYELMNHG